MRSNQNGFTLIKLLVLLIILGCILGILAILIVPSFGMFKPDESVIRAAKTMTKNPVISDSNIALFSCSSGDIMKFDVKDESGQSVGYVCKGLFKGATPRF